MKKEESPTRMFDLLADTEQMLRYARHFDSKAYLHLRGHRSADLRRQSDHLSHALLHRQARRGEEVGVVSSPRMECAYLSLGIMQAGAIPILLGTNLMAEQYLSLLADVRLLVVENGEVYSHFRLILPQLERLRLVATIEEAEGLMPLAQLIDEGRQQADEQRLEQRRNLITTDDVCLYEYCGGNQCLPVSHKQMLARLAGR